MESKRRPGWMRPSRMPRDTHRGRDGIFGPHAFKNGMHSKSPRELADLFYRCFAALGYNVGRAELPG